MRHRHSRHLVVGLTIAMVTASCSGGSDETSETDTPPATAQAEPVPTDTETAEPVTTEPVMTEPVTTDAASVLGVDAPEGLDFYFPPDPIPGEVGDIIWSREEADVPGGTAHLILYRSESLQGDPIAVSGLIYVPDQEPPPEGRAVLSWGSGTRGVADECANSRADDPAATIPILAGLLDRNVVVVASDYEGLGTPGLHPYVIGPSAARSLLDAARAAQRFEPAAAGDAVIVAGHSQGGNAQAFANELADDYAPELNIVGGLGSSAGVVAIDEGIVGFLIGSPAFRGIMVMAMAAQEAAFGVDVAPATRLLTDFGVSEMSHVEDGCLEDVIAYYSQFSQEELFRDDWDFTLATGQDFSELNEPGRSADTSPQLLIHTRDDALVPAASVSSYLDNACTHGVPIEIDWWAGGHQLLYSNADAQERALSWVDDRLAGLDPVDDCGDIPQP